MSVSGRRRTKGRAENEIDKLAQETKLMEDRLAMLRVSMKEEKDKWATKKKKTHGGTYWKNARPVDGNYADRLMKKIAAKNKVGGPKKPNSARRTPRQPQKPSQSMVKTSARPAPARGTKNPFSRPLMESSFGIMGSSAPRQQQQEANPAMASTSTVAQAASSGVGTGTGSGMDGPLLGGGNIASGAPGSLLHGPSFSESESQQGFAEARRQWLATSSSSGGGGGGGSGSGGERQGGGVRGGAQAQRAAVSGSGGGPTPHGAAGSLLDGEYDEQGNKEEFARAREEWLAQQQSLQQSKVALGSFNVAASQKAAVTTRQKASCYQCYKLFYEEKAVKDASARRAFCSVVCLTRYEATAKVACSSCGKTVVRKDAVVSALDARTYCASCNGPADPNAKAYANLLSQHSTPRTHRESPRSARTRPTFNMGPEVSFPDDDDDGGEGIVI